MFIGIVYTCHMCIAAPGKVTTITSKTATVSYGAVEHPAMIMDVVPKTGDYVLVQMGIIVKVLSEEERTSAENAWKSLDVSDASL